jgi:hypothetical protein
MTIFDERERAFEGMFVHEQEMRFRAMARRNKMVGIWAARQLGLIDREAEAYARDTAFAVVAADGEQRLLEKITTDLGLVSPYWTKDRLRQVFEEFMAKAGKEVELETS